MRKSLLRTLAMICILAVLSTCAVFASAQEQKTWTVGVSVANFSNPVYQLLMTAMQEKADAYGCFNLIMLDGKGDAAEQTAHLDSFIQQNVDLIMLIPALSDPMIPAIMRVNQSGIPLVLCDKKMWSHETGITWDCLINWDMVKSGTIGGEQVAKALGGKGNLVVIEGELGTSSMTERGGAFYDVIAQYPEINVLYAIQGDFVRDKGMQVTQDALAKFRPGEIDAMYFCNDEMLFGGLEAIKAAGRQGEFIIVSCDGDHEAMEALRRGELDYECIFLPQEQSVCIDVCYDILSGKGLDQTTPYKYGDVEIEWVEGGWEDLPWVRPTCYWVDSANMTDPAYVGW